MAPGKKRKKPVSNPARGFATVSQPSKSKEISKGKNEIESEESSMEASIPADNTQLNGSGFTDSARDLKDLSPDELEAHFEDAELQIIVEANALRCKQEAFRQVTRLETERRQLRSQANKLSTTNWLSDETIDIVLCKKDEQQDRSINERNQCVNDDIELLLKLWTLRIVLEALKFTDIDKALTQLLLTLSRLRFEASNDYIWGLKQVLEWYSVNSAKEDLPDYEQRADSNHGTDTIDASYSGAEVESFQTLTLKSTTPPPSELIDGDSSEKQEADLELSALSSTDSETDDPALFTDKYVQLQALLFYTDLHIDGKRETEISLNLRQRRTRLQRRIANLHRDVLFDADTAEAIWQQKLQELRIEKSRSVRSRKSFKRELSQGHNGVDRDGDVNDIHEDEGMLDGMFVDNQEISEELKESSADTTIRITDFGKWSGMPPRKLLEENVRNQDNRGFVKYTTLAATSYSSRLKLELKWSVKYVLDQQALGSLPYGITLDFTPQTIALAMSSIAASTPAQSESYLATILLYLLVQSGNMDNKQSMRLPTVWRDVYADLGQARQLLVETADKKVLKELRHLMSTAQEQLKQQETHSPGPAQPVETKLDVLSRTSKDHGHKSPEEAKDQWQSRVSSSKYQAILSTREQLPVHRYKDKILQEIDRNQLVLICADTGAGKSTQIPSFVLESMLSRGLDCKILVTQPRRISAISLARRVSQELGENKNDLGSERSLVGYAIRLESKTSKSTRITFATTGVLLRMIESSPQLDDLDYLILDEVHERTMDTDLLFIALRQLQQRRPSLKVVLMSATVDAQKFSNYFADAPILNIPGRTFPVEVYFLEDAIEDTLDIEVPKHSNIGHIDEDDFSDDEAKNRTESLDLGAYSTKTRSKLAQMDEYHIDYELIASLAEAIATKDKYIKYSSAILIFMPGIAEIRQLQNTILNRNTFGSDWVIHLLHSSFSTEDLERAFSIPSRGMRKIVIATNIAETGITIPDVTAVIDTCKEKIMRFDERRQLSRLTEGFISRSSARQRRGRAARVQEGLCFHLITRHRFENLILEQQVPEMLRLSLQDPILRVKVWNLGSIESTLASAIDPPSAKNVRRAIDKLKDTGALSNNEELTSLGRKIARLPLDVVLSKLAIFGIVFRCLDAVATMIATMSSKSPFITDKSGHQLDSRLAFARGDSDLISTLNAYQGWRRAKLTGQSQQFCRKHHLSEQSFSSIEDQKIQLLVYLVDAGLLQFDSEEKAQLNRSRVTGNRKTFFTIPDRFNMYENDAMLNCAIAMAFYPRILTREGKGWRNVYTNQRVNLTSNSVNRATDKPPRWLCFYEATQVRSGALNVLETSKVPEIIIVTLLGSADIKLFAGAIILDNGKMRFSLRQWRQVAAVKALRDSLANVLQRCWQAPGLALSSSDQQWIDLLATIVAPRDTKSN